MTDRSLHDLIRQYILHWGPEREKGAAGRLADIIIGEVQAASPLDVGRLRRAMSLEVKSDDLDPIYRRPTVEEIAAEYARLGSAR